MEASSEIELRAGTGYQLVLCSPGGTGYVWESEVIGPPDVIRIRELCEEPHDVDRSVMQNYSVDCTYVIEALQPGKAQARFVFRRPWEKDISPLQVKYIRVNVIE